MRLFILMLFSLSVHAEPVQLDSSTVNEIKRALIQIRKEYWSSGRDQPIYNSLVWMETELNRAQSVSPPINCEKESKK